MDTVRAATDKAEAISSVADVQQRLLALDKALPSTTLESLAVFNTAYLLIITEMHTRLGSGYFHDEAAVARFESIFVGHYLNALRKYIDGEEVSPAWRSVFQACEQQHTSRLGHLVLGVNAHVNQDLCLSLYEVDPPASFAKDLGRTTALINQLSREMLKQCKIVTPINGLIPFGMRIKIHLWSLRAWRTYERLKASDVTREAVTKRTGRSARVYSLLFRG